MATLTIKFNVKTWTIHTDLAHKCTVLFWEHIAAIIISCKSKVGKTAKQLTILKVLNQQNNLQITCYSDMGNNTVTITTGTFQLQSTNVISTPSGHEYSSPTCLPDKSLWSHGSTGTPWWRAWRISTRCTKPVQVAEQSPLLCHLHWLRAPSGYPSSSPSWCTSAPMDLNRPTWLMHFSQLPGFLVDNACGHRRLRHWMFPTYMTVHCRRPSVPRHRDTNMEQFARWSDVIKFPATLKTKLKSNLFLASLP